MPLRHALVAVSIVLAGVAALAQQAANPRQQPGAAVTVFAPEQHDLYDGHFVLSANRIYMVGGLNDAPGWDHMDNAAATVKPVGGVVNVNVNEIQNSGTFEVALKIPEGDLVLAIDRFNEFAACQNGGIVAYLHEHGSDSGCGDNNWPKTFVYLAGWGFGHATLNGKPLRSILYDTVSDKYGQFLIEELLAGAAGVMTGFAFPEVLVKIVSLYKAGKTPAIITQNIDNLHQASGFKADDVVELHGNTTYARCIGCGHAYDLPWVKARFEETGDAPDCTLCDDPAWPRRRSPPRW